jgi:hypothetical protein
VRRKSKITYNPSKINRFGNKYNIEFNVNKEENDDLDLIFFNSLVNDDILLRNLPVYCNLSERRNRLLRYLKIEQLLIRIQEAIA